MTGNTRILTHEFDYFEPENLQTALEFLNRFGPEAKIIAGGTDLLPQLKQEKTSPACLINIMKIEELSYIREEGGLRIGAGTKLRNVREYCSRGAEYRALQEAISLLGKPQIWNMGTIGGNLCNASPSADTAPPLLVYSGKVKLISEKGERILPLEDFFMGVNRTALVKGEMMVEIQIDPIPEAMGSAFMKISRVGADISKISCAVAVVRRGEQCALCRIALGAVAPVPIRAKGAESLLQGNQVSPSLVEKAGQKVAKEIRPIDDIRSTAAYRRDVANVLFKDCFWTAWRRASGEEE
jgi:carbon-monoxide dehydrogenase medium subunit